MKIISFVPIFLWIVAAIINLPPSCASAAEAKPDGGGTVIQRGPNHRIIRQSSEDKLPNGKTRLRNFDIVELQSGMHRFDPSANGGTWVSTSDELHLTDGGAIGTNSAHNVTFASDSTAEGALQIALSDGVIVKTHFSGLVFQDGTGAAVFFPAKQSIGEFTPPNTVTYRNVVDGLDADLVIVNGRAKISHSILFPNQFPFSIADLGLNEESTRILIYTQLDQAPLARIAEGEFLERGVQIADDTLQLGALNIGKGKAFPVNVDSPRTDVSVAKRFVQADDGRRFIVESVAFPLIKPYLAGLEAPQQARNSPQKKSAQFAAAPPLPRLGNLRNLTPAQSAIRAEQKTALATLSKSLPPLPTGRTRQGRMKSLAVGEANKRKGFLVDFEGITSPATNVTFAPGLTYYVSGDYAIYGTNYLYPCVIKFAPTNTARITSHGKLICKTEFGSPCILTARDDNSVGEVLPGTSGSQPSGFYADTAIYFTDYNMSDLSHLRISYANTALAYDDNTGAASASTHLQITHCKTAFALRVSAPTFRNVLVYDVQTNLFSSSYAATTRFEHLTLDQANTFLGAPYYTPDILLTNTILAAVTNFGPGYKTNSSSNVEIVADPSTIFTNLGGASHYLLPQYQPIASSYINAKLQLDFRYCSVHQPFVLTNVITTNTILRPIADRMADVLTCGYAYPAIDFIASGAGVSNCTVTLSPGCTLAGHTEGSSVAFVLYDGGSLISEGSPTNHIKFWRYNVAQEQATTNWISSSPGILFAPGWWGPSPQPTARFQFTDFSSVVQGGYLLYSFGNSASLPFTHCEFHGGAVYTEGSDLYTTNSLLESVSTTLTDGNRSLSAIYQNCLFYGGNTSLDHIDSGTWKFRDNLFLNSPISYDADPVDADYNAFATNAITLPTTSGTHDLILTNASIAFQSGALGRFYVPTNSQTIDRGHTTGGGIGLFWFTTVTNATLCESNTTVDIGFHAVAVGTNGLPRDDDGDGLFNVTEDKNGSGARDAGESAFLTSGTDQDSDGDGVSDFIETLLGRNPLVAGSTNDSTGTLNLKVYTPLK